jgi:ATP-dependent RNA helicase DHX8/PRP22
MAELEQLEFLNLVGKITQEIETYAGVNDKTLAQFVISLHDESKGNLQTFQTKLKEVGADFPESFVNNVDRLILSMHPKHKKGKQQKTLAEAPNTGGKEELTEKDKQRRLFPGLAMQDKDVPEPVSDDVFLKEIGDLVGGRKSRTRPSFDEPPPKRPRLDASPPRRRRSTSRSPPPRGRSDRRDNWGAPPPSTVPRRTLDERPVLYKIYNGRVTGLKDFGAFVTLEGIAGRAEGMFTCVLI